MKKNLTYLLFSFVIFTTIGCSVSRCGYKNKVSKRQLKESMKYSDWRYYYPTKSITQTYQNNHYNVYDYNTQRKTEKDN
jgi:hypothetical protein